MRITALQLARSFARIPSLTALTDALAVLQTASESDSKPQAPYYGTLPAGAVVVIEPLGNGAEIRGIFSGCDGRRILSVTFAEPHHAAGLVSWLHSYEDDAYQGVKNSAGFTQSLSGAWVPARLEEIATPGFPAALPSSWLPVLERSLARLGAHLERVWDAAPQLFDAQPEIGPFAILCAPVGSYTLLWEPHQDAKMRQLLPHLAPYPQPAPTAAPAPVSLPVETPPSERPQTLRRLLGNRALTWDRVLPTLTHFAVTHDTSAGKGSHTRLYRDGKRPWTVSNNVRSTTQGLYYPYLTRMLAQLGIPEPAFAANLEKARGSTRRVEP